MAALRYACRGAAPLERATSQPKYTERIFRMFAKKGKNTDSYDAVIIGAGPAGAAAARDLVLERFGAPPPEVFSRSGPIFWNHIA